MHKAEKISWQLSVVVHLDAAATTYSTLLIPRYGKNPAADLLKVEMERLNRSLGTSEAEAQKLGAELAAEKLSGRKRHANLVDDLIKVCVLCVMLRDAPVLYSRPS
jgi:hypothetical protein